MKRIIIFALSILVLTQAYAFSQADAQSRADLITVSVSTVSPTYQKKFKYLLSICPF